jgi:catechol 2,3-dioxygenase-like lactoylglutathione lyase family enzyme
MQIQALFHVAIKTSDLDATVRFYTRVLGLEEAARPDFGYPGAWLAIPNGGDAIIHIYAGGPALGPGGTVASGSAAIDHLSLMTTGYHDFRARFEQHGLPYREFVVPNTTYWQLFVYDPSGVQLELTFDGAKEEGALPDMSPGRSYVAGVSFFDPAVYRRFGQKLGA